MSAGSHVGFDLGNPRISLILKFGLDRICSFRDIAIFIMAGNCLFMLIFRRGIFPQITSPNVLNRKRTILAWKRRLSHKAWNQSSGSTCVQDQEKKQDSHKNHISPIWGEAPTVSTETKIRLVCYLPNVITCAKFRGEIFKRLNFAFSYWFCAACDLNQFPFFPFSYNNSHSSSGSRITLCPFSYSVYGVPTTSLLRSSSCIGCASLSVSPSNWQF